MKYFFFLPFFAIIAACTPNSSTTDKQPLNKDSLRAALMEVDKSWSEISLKKGYYHSRNEFMAENAVEMMQGAMPLVGKQAIMEYTATHPDTAFTMQWKPLRGEVASSGDLGYTYGAWTLKQKAKNGNDTTLYGTYITVWQKQADGSWKFVADGGNDTPWSVEK